MNIANYLSIRSKTYLLVMLIVVVALILSIVSNSGLNTIRNEMDDLLYVTKIEHYTGKLINEERNYRLNANGSVYDIEAANKAYNDAIIYINKIQQIHGEVDVLGRKEGDLLLANLKKTQDSTRLYEELYLTAAELLTELNRQAEILESEGEYITLQIQQYVESKRVEVKKTMLKSSIEKVNNGSNIWQYTYVTRLHEKKYRLSPDDTVFGTFKKDFRFMMSEWQRLKEMSDQDFEFEKLEKFYTSAKQYEVAMLSWASLNERLATEVLPKMELLGNSIIASSIQSAEHSIEQMSTKHNTITLTLISVSVIVILLGILFGAMIARSISSVIASFQDGLLNFFQYLNQQQKTALPIIVHGHDEISNMADVINENIIKIQSVFDRKTGYQLALMEWSKVDYQDRNLTLSKATELSAKALNVERVSIWLFNDDQTALTCEDMYIHDTGQHESGAILTEKDYSEYFEAIRSSKILVANNAREDSRTEAFLDDYLKPLNIYSMMDSPIIQHERIVGVICHEKTGKIKIWEQDEQDFAGSMVNAVSLSLEIKKRELIQEELKIQKEALHHHAHHDSLTNLPNRFLFNDRLDQAIKQAMRDSTKLAVLFVDLDHFKGINDSMGHRVGDELLVEVAKRLRGEIRQTDTLARLGGDEFSIVINQVSNNDSVVEITQNLIKIMNTPIELRDRSFYVTLSIGVAIFPDDGKTSEELLKNADAAMYQAKDDGRNTYQFYTLAMTEKAFERIAMESSFRDALQREEFIVHYQPQVNAKTDAIIGLEALVRWNHPSMGLISPSKFLTFANDTGLIVPLDWWVMETAMMQHANWYQSGLQPGVLALNITLRQLQQEDFIDSIKQLLKETGCKARWLEFEVTEGQLMKDSSAAIEVLNRIKELGISLAIDDFGTGYSSLSQLKRLPINKLKIDQSFIRDLPHDDEDVVISKTIIALAKNMGLSVIAEGVETVEQKEFLLQNGCHYIQGFYFSKPMIASKVEDKLTAR
ncbi:MAG: EAL domain-containing protein [Proteobacteria bacterium]|nr:EAL domain-containing protein [Pseudomonadota bacterium]